MSLDLWDASRLLRGLQASNRFDLQQPYMVIDVLKDLDLVADDVSYCQSCGCLYVGVDLYCTKCCIHD